MHNFTIVVMNKYPELASNLIKSLVKLHPVKTPDIFIVRDNHDTEFDHARGVTVNEPFLPSRNINIGISSNPGKDILFCNDDMQCTDINFAYRLGQIAHSYSKCGILSPLIDGGVGNEWQQFPMMDAWSHVPGTEIAIDRTVCFPCVYIKRAMIDAIGMMDEAFVDYGFEDDDMCIRARAAGWMTMITSRLSIKHGEGGNHLQHGRNWSLTYARSNPEMKSNLEVFLTKYPQLAK